MLYYKVYNVLYVLFRDINIYYISMTKWLWRTFVRENKFSILNTLTN